ncbi:MAG TPA: glycosyltransferase family 39 protein [Vicinamibacterales bacterium]|nr:glycosyltransferase family 39 protein [Vicinamibacterales bacterium]
MDRGQLLYRDVWEQRPPAIYWMYLAAFRTFGWHDAAVAWLDTLMAALTALLVYAVGRRLAGRTTGATAAALFAVLTMPSWLYGYGGFLERANSETFIVVLVCAMALAAVRWTAHCTFWQATLFGLAAGATLVFKPNAGLYFPAMLLWAALYATPHRSDGRRTLAMAGTACAAALIVPAATLLWLWRLDLLHEARVAVIDFNRYYVGEGFDIPAYAVAFSKAVWLRIKTDPLWLGGTVGAAAAVGELVRRRRLPPLPGLAVVWGAATVCVIVVNGARLFNSYFIQALPPLALMAAWLLSHAGARSRAYRLAVWTTAALMAVLLVTRDFSGRVFGQAAADLRLLSGREDRMSYLERFGGYANRRGYSARANAELADYVREQTTPDERIFLFGINGAGVYYAAERLTAHRFLRVNFFVETDFPHPAFRLPAVVAELQRVRPRLVIFERLHVSSDPEMARRADSLPQDPVVAQLLENYDLDATIEDFTVYRLR